MRWIMPVFSALAFVCAAASAFAADTSRASLILDRLKNANLWRQHVMVVAHRAGWKENGTIRLPEDSLAAIRRAIELGAEMVELDVRRSADGALVIMHVSWLDRTTTCKGEVDTFTLSALKACKLVIEGSGIVTDESVPTLKEALLAAKGHVLVNIDNKLGSDTLPDIAAEAREIGMADQILMKENVWNAQRIAATTAVLAKVGSDVAFMPILADDAVHEAGFMAQATKTFSAPAAELVNWHTGGTPLTERGGALFSAKARAAAILGNWHLWVNTYTIVDRPVGMLAGGRGDELAIRDGRPEETYGFWVDRGATIIQTDEPKAAIEWLAANGLRVPYADEPLPVAAISPSN